MAPVDSTLSARLASLFDKSTGKTQAALARYCGVSTSAVNQWTKSGKIFDSNLRKVAEFFGVSQRWLQTGEGEKTAQVLSYGVGDKIPDGFVAIPEYRLEFSAGSGSEPTWELIHDSEDCWYRVNAKERKSAEIRWNRSFKMETPSSLKASPRLGPVAFISLTVEFMYSPLTGSTASSTFPRLKTDYSSHLRTPLTVLKNMWVMSATDLRF